MSEQQLRMTVIIGSTREHRFGEHVARWFIAYAREHSDMHVDVVDLLDAGLPARLTDDRTSEVQRFAERIEAADAIVVITPEYNHSFPASVKQAIDWLKDEWRAKAVAFVSYGGISGGLRAVEHLRLVFAELHAVTIRDTVSFPFAHELFDDVGRLKAPAGPEEAATTMLNHLSWWAFALREARLNLPYGRPVQSTVGVGTYH